MDKSGQIRKGQDMKRDEKHEEKKKRGGLGFDILDMKIRFSFLAGCVKSKEDFPLFSFSTLNFQQFPQPPPFFFTVEEIMEKLISKLILQIQTWKNKVIGE